MPEVWTRVPEGDLPLKLAGPARLEADWDALIHAVAAAVMAYGDSHAGAAAQLLERVRLGHLHWHGSGEAPNTASALTLAVFGSAPPTAVLVAGRRNEALQGALRDVLAWLTAEHGAGPLQGTLCLVVDVDAYNRGRTGFGTDGLSARGMATLLAQFEAGGLTRHTRLVRVCQVNREAPAASCGPPV